MIKIEDKTVFKSACLMIYITLFGAFGNYIIHVAQMPFSIVQVVMFQTVFEYMFNIGASYCILFVMAWIMNYSGILNDEGNHDRE